MASLADAPSLEFVKGIVLGAPGSGKTGCLTSLVKAGYDLRIWDFDNLLHTLATYVKRDCPERLASVKVQTFTDKLKATGVPAVMMGNAMKVMPIADGTPTAYVNGLLALNKWKTDSEDLGNPAEWGKKSVVVIDSLTTAANAAFRYVRAMNPAGREPQADYHSAQQLIINLVTLLCAEQFKTNVLILAHISNDRDDKGNVVKGWPRSVGSALNDQLGGYFNTVLMVDAQVPSRRVIRTNSTGIVDLKNPIPFKVAAELPLDTGLATFFEAVTS